MSRPISSPGDLASTSSTSMPPAFSRSGFGAPDACAIRHSKLDSEVPSIVRGLHRTLSGSGEVLLHPLAGGRSCRTFSSRFKNRD